MVKPTIGVLAAAGMLVSGIVPLSSYASADMKAIVVAPAGESGGSSGSSGAGMEEVWARKDRRGLPNLYDGLS